MTSYLEYPEGLTQTPCMVGGWVTIYFPYYYEQIGMAHSWAMVTSLEVRTSNISTINLRGVDKPLSGWTKIYFITWWWITNKLHLVLQNFQLFDNWWCIRFSNLVVDHKLNSSDPTHLWVVCHVIEFKVFEPVVGLTISWSDSIINKTL